MAITLSGVVTCTRQGPLCEPTAPDIRSGAKQRRRDGLVTLRPMGADVKRRVPLARASGRLRSHGKDERRAERLVASRTTELACGAPGGSSQTALL